MAMLIITNRDSEYEITHGHAALDSLRLHAPGRYHAYLLRREFFLLLVVLLSVIETIAHTKYGCEIQ